MKLKKFISLVLCFPLLLAVSPVVFAEEKPSARLYNVYGDNMLFKQNDDAVFAGVGNPGNTVGVKLFNAEKELVRSSESVVKDDGTFEVSFLSPKGGYEEYTVVAYDNGVEFDKLTGVVFGEMWLASGQSNMEYELFSDLTIDEVRQNGYGSKWVRALLVGRHPWTDEAEAPFSPNELNETPNESVWVKSNDPQIEKVSAVGYFFAQKLQKELDMPVGILNANRGGSPICSWLSRQRVENDPTALEMLKKRNQYFTVEKYYSLTDEQRSLYTNGNCAFSNYNAQIYPIRHFRLSGMIWYQGETDVGIGYKRGEYSYMFDLLQKEISETFSFGGDLPIILSQLAVFGPYPTPVQVFNDELASLREQKPESRALVTIYDVFPSYNSDNVSIHPNQKQPVGERMEYVAKSLVYGKDGITSAPYVEKTVIDGNSVLVTLSNVGDGLAAVGDKFYDYAVCGEDGVYFKAEAETVSEDTVRIWSDQVKNPVAATYAISSVNLRADLFATENGELIMPVSPFITDVGKSKAYYFDSPYMDMEQAEVWEPRDGQYDPSWLTHDCTYTMTPDSACEGQNGMSLTASSKEFAFYRKYGVKNVGWYENINSNWSGYKSLKLKIRNTGSESVTLKDLRIGIGDKVWYAPTVNGTAFFSTVIPADGQWHTVEYDLTNIYRNKTVLLKFSNEELEKVYDIQFNFKSKSDSSTLDIDDMQFCSSVECGQSKRPVSFVIRAYRFVNSLFAKIGDFFKSIFG